MNPDEILKLARKAGIIIRNGRLDVKPNVDLLGSLEHFAKLVLWSDALFQSLIAGERAAEREACAKACEKIEQDRWNLYKGRPPYTGSEAGRADPHEQGVSMGAGECAAAIRERGNK